MAAANNERILDVFYRTWHIPAGIFSADFQLKTLYFAGGERQTRFYLDDSRYILKKEHGSTGPVMRYDSNGSCWCLIPLERSFLLLGPVQTGRNPSFPYEGIPEQSWESFRRIAGCLASLITGSDIAPIEKEDSFTETYTAGQLPEHYEGVQQLESFDELFDCIRTGDIDLLKTLLNTGSLRVYLDHVMTDIQTARHIFYFNLSKAFHTAQEASASMQDLVPLVNMYFREEAGYRSIAAYKAGMHRIMYDFSRYVSRTKKERYSTLVNTAMFYINEHLQQMISVEEIAARCSVSVSALQHRFRAETGVSVSEKIRELKMAKACWLLKHTDLPCGTIAYRMGYSSQSYFTKQFRRQTGMTPQMYRTQSGS